ncbi:hypothetical protein BV22DRAFT_1055309 [Leucogyrophana mollusca]|uniref:Uncharacterized protein n=1 Tax=Leucogyrophana mollusca TaxID=85980 RepID=A0ACB8BZQ6_9AGAM|nr:hypothetical protein BV22DRAFT_1055309 [Leucogyrophana mollusca]
MSAPPTDPHALLHYNMVRAHEIFKLGYSNIVSRLDDPPMNDLKNFLGYCSAWAKTLGHHHDTEEKVVFPAMRGKIDFAGEQDQHQVIHTALEEILPYILASQQNPTTFDAQKLKGMMEGLRDPLFQHLDDEIEHIDPQTLRVIDYKDMQALNKEIDRFAQTTGDPFIIVPFMLSHIPPDIKVVWPELPWFVKKVLVPWIFAWRFSGYWKYSPYEIS